MLDGTADPETRDYRRCRPPRKRILGGYSICLCRQVSLMCFKYLSRGGPTISEICRLWVSSDRIPTQHSWMVQVAIPRRYTTGSVCYPFGNIIVVPVILKSLLTLLSLEKPTEPTERYVMESRQASGTRNSSRLYASHPALLDGTGCGTRGRASGSASYPSGRNVLLGCRELLC
ncbi:hypothetical protein K470DRAFT_139735 [Piedraia hortae CBS 480.64]|uniref:Uncharacterized protein n=1 Tax=Piedraia hortae CBS 480.64 TaxID=1314780 RepID=A0A6A7C794_9PEZI|nr:hypothetical protein K470DRAFT_139735 [Piedraia hortae CBS 480.64]